MKGGDIMKINTLINSIKSKRVEIHDDEGLKNITKGELDELDKFVIEVLNQYSKAYSSEEEDTDFEYYLVLLEMDRARLHSMIR